MASAGPAPSGKRAFDAEFNLVPFIDLLSCCVCFLLVSAVWTQVAKIDTKPAPNIPTETPQNDNEVRLTVHVRFNGYFLSDGRSSMELPLVAGKDYPLKDLDGKLKGLKEIYPEVTQVTVMADDIVPYRELVAAMDLCLRNGLGDITVQSSGV
jgi:biopolymer transport protein ExbD